TEGAGRPANPATSDRPSSCARTSNQGVRLRWQEQAIGPPTPLLFDGRNLIRRDVSLRDGYTFPGLRPRIPSGSLEGRGRTTPRRWAAPPDATPTTRVVECGVVVRQEASVVAGMIRSRGRGRPGRDPSWAKSGSNRTNPGSFKGSAQALDV